MAAIDAVTGKLVARLQSMGAEILIVSEYGISPVSRPVHINRLLRDHGLLRVRKSSTWELLDCGASRAFAVADHQIAHVYIRDDSDIPVVKELLDSADGIDQVMTAREQKDAAIHHQRCGELIAVAEQDAWFTYYYWLDDSKAPDFAPTVDIHRKPGYDPLELFIDPEIRFPRARVAGRLAQKKLGMRMLMDVIPLDATLVKGSHGRPASSPEAGPLLISSSVNSLQEMSALTDVSTFIVDHFNTGPG